MFQFYGGDAMSDNFERESELVVGILNGLPVSDVNDITALAAIIVPDFDVSGKSVDAINLAVGNEIIRLGEQRDKKRLAEIAEQVTQKFQKRVFGRPIHG